VANRQQHGVRVASVHLHRPAPAVARRNRRLDRLGAGNVLATDEAGVGWARATTAGRTTS
jgi:hypothetical protein